MVDRGPHRLLDRGGEWLHRGQRIVHEQCVAQGRFADAEREGCDGMRVLRCRPIAGTSERIGHISALVTSGALVIV